MIVEFTFGSHGNKRVEQFEYPDDTPEDNIEEDYLNWRENFIDGTWRIL